MKNFWKKIALSQKIFASTQWNPDLPGIVPNVYNMIQEKNQDFAREDPGRFVHFQIWSKTTKMAKNLQKRPLLGRMSVSAKNFSANLHSDRFWSHSDQKKSIFAHIENSGDFTVEKWPNSKSGPFWPKLTKKTWSNGLSISPKQFPTDFELFGNLVRKLYPKI